MSAGFAHPTGQIIGYSLEHPRKDGLWPQALLHPGAPQRETGVVTRVCVERVPDIVESDPSSLDAQRFCRTAMSTSLRSPGRMRTSRGGNTYLASGDARTR